MWTRHFLYIWILNHIQSNTNDGKRSGCINVAKKLNTIISTEAELVGSDDASSLILWTKLF